MLPTGYESRILQPAESGTKSIEVASTGKRLVTAKSSADPEAEYTIGHTITTCRPI